jgi:hypothetical protein
MGVTMLQQLMQKSGKVKMGMIVMNVSAAMHRLIKE